MLEEALELKHHGIEAETERKGITVTSEMETIVSGDAVSDG